MDQRREDGSERLDYAEPISPFAAPECHLPVPRDHPRCQQHGTTSGPLQSADEMIPSVGRSVKPDGQGSGLAGAEEVGDLAGQALGDGTSEAGGHDDRAPSSAQADHPRSLGRTAPGGGRAHVDFDADRLGGVALAGPVGTDSAGCRAEHCRPARGRAGHRLRASRCRADHCHRRIVSLRNVTLWATTSSHQGRIEPRWARESCATATTSAGEQPGHDITTRGAGGASVQAGPPMCRRGSASRCAGRTRPR